MNPQTVILKVSRLKSIYAAVTAGTILICLALTGCRQGSVTSEAHSYAEDRALIEDLQARYMFALDFGDLDKYVATFTEDGILDIGEGEWRSRDTIRKVLSSIPQQEEIPDDLDTPELHSATGRHCIANIVIKIEGDTAYGRAYWFHMSDNNPQRSATLDSYGHYEDVMVRVDGGWLFSKRKIYNEQVSSWAASANNPSL